MTDQISLIIKCSREKKDFARSAIRRARESQGHRVFLFPRVGSANHFCRLMDVFFIDGAFAFTSYADQHKVDRVTHCPINLAAFVFHIGVGKGFPIGVSVAIHKFEHTACSACQSLTPRV